MKLSLMIRDKYELGDVLHMTHVSNLESILASKVISSKAKLTETNKKYTDISNSSVQDGRSLITIPCSGHELHQYVPLYWGKKTPMVASLQGQNDDLIFLQFTADLLEDHDCVVSDGNARTNGTIFREFKEITDLEILDPKSINTVKYAHDAEIKRRKQAELLVHDFIGLEHLKCIICHNEDVKSKVMALISAHRVKCGVYVNVGAYYFKL
jgi:hypothetical protein